MHPRITERQTALAGSNDRRGRTRGGASGLVLLVLLLGAIAGGIWYGFFREGGNVEVDVALTDPLRRGPMRVTISEAGSLEALDSHAVINRVEGKTVIDYIVPEGTVLTEADVANKTVLVRLNTAELVERRIQQEIEVAAAQDAYKSAETSLEIQIHENESQLRKAQLLVHFARLDLKRYVGETFADKLLASYAASVQTPPRALANAKGGGTAGSDDVETEVGLASLGLRRLIASLLDSEGLDGEALQTIRGLTSDIHLAKEELGRAEEKKRQSARLLEKGYVSAEEFEADKLALQRRVIAEEQANTAHDQFVSYDFPKQVAKLLSEVIEAEDAVVREQKSAAAAESQKRSALISKEKQKELKVRRLQSYLAQEEMCVLYATVPGLVVYASSGNERRWGNNERIDVGASVREGQELIQIPSPSSLGASISVHETFIDRVKEGQQAWITVDAMPGVRIPARVKNVARLPNPADRWLNPDLKVYTTILEFLDSQPDLKPGMSAEVEILIAKLDDVLSAPVQAIAGSVDEPAVYLWTDAGPVRKPVVLGLASEHFVQISEGVEVGDRLLLDPPRDSRPSLSEAEERAGDEADTAAAPAAEGKKGKKDRKTRGADAPARSRTKGAPAGKKARTDAK
jgi:multidrug resistance efflux pump